MNEAKNKQKPISLWLPKQTQQKSDGYDELEPLKPFVTLGHISY